MGLDYSVTRRMFSLCWLKTLRYVPVLWKCLLLLITSTGCRVDGVHVALCLYLVYPLWVKRILMVSGLMQVIGVFMLAEVSLPLREVVLLNVFDRNLLSTFLVVSWTIFSDSSDLIYLHIFN